MSSLFKSSTQAEMLASFPEVCHAATEIAMRELIRILYYLMKCAKAHNTEYDRLNMFYVMVPPRIYQLIAGASTRHPGVPQRPRDTPDYGMEQTSTGQAQIRDVWAHEKLSSIEDENMNRILTTTFLALLPREEIKGFQEYNLANDPKMKFLSVFDHFWSKYGTVREEDVLENTQRMQADW